jgi:WD40 repeat protein
MFGTTEASSPIRLAFSPNGRWLACCTGEFSLAPNEVKVWDLGAGTDRVLTSGPVASDLDLGLCLAFHPDGRTLVAGKGRGVLTQWDVATGKKLGETKVDYLAGKPTDGTSCVRGLAFSPDGNTLAANCANYPTGESGPRSNAVQLWKVNRKP